MNAPRFSRRYWFNLIGFSLVAIVVGYFAYVYLGVSYFMAKGFTEPRRMEVCRVTPADKGLAYEDVEFTTEDGITIHGWYIPSENHAAVILLHSMASNRMGTMDHALMFARHGYSMLMIDLRAHGESGVRQSAHARRSEPVSLLGSFHLHGNLRRIVRMVCGGEENLVMATSAATRTTDAKRLLHS